MKKSVTLDIAGASYRMSADADEERLQALADLVNERVEALGPRAAQQASPAQLLAMVALGLADDLLEATERRERVESVTRSALAKAISRIDQRLADDMQLSAEC